MILDLLKRKIYQNLKSGFIIFSLIMFMQFVLGINFISLSNLDFILVVLTLGIVFNFLLLYLDKKGLKERVFNLSLLLSIFTLLWYFIMKV